MVYSNGRLVDSSLKLLQMLSRELAAYSPPITKDSLGNLLSETLSNLMKVVMNLTHDSNDDCELLFCVSLFALLNPPINSLKMTRMQQSAVVYMVTSL